MKNILKKALVTLTASMTLVSPLLTQAPAVLAQESESENFIADRTITGLIFQSAGDASVEIPQEILDEIKRQTGVTFELQTVTSDDSITV